MVTQRLEALRRTKFYDLFAAAPLIAWYAFCAAHVLPSVSQQIALVKLFVQTDPTALPMGLLLRTLAHVTTLIFFAILVVMFAIRYVPQRTAPRFYARCAAVAGTFLSVGIVLLPPQELSSALYLISLILIITGTVFAIWAGLSTRALDQHPAGSSATGNLGALCSRTTPTLSWRDRRACWNYPAIPVSMGATVAGTAIRIPTAAYEKRGAVAISSLSGIRRLHGADAPFATGPVLEEFLQFDSRPPFV